MSVAGKHALVTGASSGIGEALCRELARAGYRMSIVARRGDLLERLRREIGGEIHVIARDLSDSAAAGECLASAEGALGPIDVLVNNAGAQMIGYGAVAKLERTEALLRLNLQTPLRLIAGVVPRMLEARAGSIVNIASTAAFAPTPYMAHYSASKAALAAISEALRGELLGSGVHVLTVYPGPIDTPMAAAGYAAYEKALSSRLMPVGSPATLARRIRCAIERRRGRIVYPRVYVLARWFPGTTRYLLDRWTPKPRSPEALLEKNGGSGR